MIAVVPASPRHVGRIAANIRTIDARECAAFGRTPKQALRQGLATSLMSATALVDGQPVAMFGVSALSFVEGTGRPWLLGTDAVALRGLALTRMGRRYVEAMHRAFPILDNWVAAENDLAIKWLRRMGFRLTGEVQNCRDLDMLRFERRAAHV